LAPRAIFLPAFFAPFLAFCAAAFTLRLTLASLPFARDRALAFALDFGFDFGFDLDFDPAFALAFAFVVLRPAFFFFFAGFRDAFFFLAAALAMNHLRR
jgi:hypothetical protein